MPGNVNAEEMQALLQTNIPGMGVINVDRTRTRDCAEPEWSITWLTIPGQLPLIEVSLLVAGLCYNATFTATVDSVSLCDGDIL